MTIRRRYFTVPEGTREIIVTHDDVTHAFLVGHRAASWDEFSRPCDADRVEDDEPLDPEAIDRHAPTADGTRSYPTVPFGELDAPEPAEYRDDPDD